MRALAFVIAALMPMAAAAEPVVLRIEAKRDPAAAAASAARWRGRFDDVVTFPLKGGWTGIALGPMERAAAQARLDELRRAGTVPGDSFLAPPPEGMTPVAGTGAADAAGDTEAVEDAPGKAADAEAPTAGSMTGTGDSAGDANPANGDVPVTSDGAAMAGDAPAAGIPSVAEAASAGDLDAVPAAPAGEPAAPTTAGPGEPPADLTPDDATDGPAATAGEPAAAAAAGEPAAAMTSDDTGEPAAAAPQAGSAADAAAPASAETAAPAPDPLATAYIRLQALPDRARADEALAEWRRDFPEAGLWRLSNDRFAVALGPLTPDTAEAWLAAFKAADRAPRDAVVAQADTLGEAVEPGRAPDLPAPGDAAMPPLDEVQRALRWAGRYDGPIDGKDGPRTRQSIAAEILAERAAPDAPTAMRALIDRRAAWRADMGLTRLDDAASGLSVDAPMDRLEFQRTEQGLSIYGPRNGSGAALILYSAPGGQQEMLDFTGLVTALGWVPAPERRIGQGHAALTGRNDTHIGQAEARVADGRVEGVVLIWPAADAPDQPRVVAELIDSLTRTPAAPAADAPAGPDPAAPAGQ